MNEHWRLSSTTTSVTLKYYITKAVIYLVIVGIFKCLWWNFTKLSCYSNDGLQSCLNRRNVTYHSRNFQFKPERKRSVFDARKFLSHCAPKLRIFMTEEISKLTKKVFLNKPHKACKYVKRVLPVCEKFLN